MFKKYIACLVIACVMILSACIPVYTSVTGDIDGDGVVGLPDIMIIAQCFNSMEGEPDFNPAADLVPDGVIGLPDIFVVAINFTR